MNEILYDGVTLKFVFYGDEKLREVIRKDFSAYYEPKQKCWIGSSLLKYIVNVQDFADKYKFTISEKSRENINNTILQSLRKIQLSESENEDNDIINIDKRLINYQKNGIIYALMAKKAIIADEMGLGKTIQALYTAHIASAFPCLIVTTKPLKYNWADEINKWFDNKYSCTLIPENGYNVSDFNIIHYNILEKNEEYLKDKKYKCIIFDESHSIKNKASKRTKSSIKISKNSEYVLLLTGTPILNRPVELVAPLTLLNKLHDFGGYFEFLRKYCDAKHTQFGLDTRGASNIEELNFHLRSSCFIRRKKRDVAKELPEKRRIEIHTELSNQKQYNTALNNLKQYLIDVNFYEKQFIEKIKGLSNEEIEKIIKSDINNINKKISKAERIIQIEKLKQLCAKGKLDAVYDWVDNFLETGEKLVLFAIHKEIIASLLEKYPHAAHILAEDSPEEVDKQKKKFTDDDSCNILIGAMGTSAGSSPAGLGHNLIVASNVAFIELGWTAGHHDQCEDRCLRIGQKNMVNCYYFLGKDTIDNHIMNILNEKRNIIDVFDGTKDNSAFSITDVFDDLQQIIMR